MYPHTLKLCAHTHTHPQNRANWTTSIAEWLQTCDPEFGPTPWDYLFNFWNSWVRIDPAWRKKTWNFHEM